MHQNAPKCAVSPHAHQKCKTNPIQALALIAPLLFSIASQAFAGGVVFNACIDSSVRKDPATGRLIVYVAKATTEPTPQNLDHWEMLFGTDVNNLAPGSIATVDDAASFHPRKLSTLTPGNYLAQAVLDIHQDDSNWRREPGNLFSRVVAFTVIVNPTQTPTLRYPEESDRPQKNPGLPSTSGPASNPSTATTQPTHINLSLTQIIQPKKYPTTQGAELFEIQSKKLTDFHHRPIMLRAFVVFPLHQNPEKKYPALYRIPGFGGDGISMVAHPSAAFEDGPAGEQLARNLFHIWLDPESGNGHDLCANSDNNGPVGDAIIHELIPALEKKYNLIATADARMLRGHSSGGWAALWLQLQYPQTFGACFAASPDPVDFRHLEQIDIYHFDNAYEHDGKILVGSRSPTAASVREENAVEEVLGPHNSSAHDWDAWQAAWGTRDIDGHVAALFDPQTGKIDHKEAETWRRYDITDLLVNHPENYLATFHQRIRLIVGDQDNFFLNDAVASLKAELDKMPAVPGKGYIKIVQGYNHGTIGDAPEFKAFYVQMLDHLREHGLIETPR